MKNLTTGLFLQETAVTAVFRTGFLEKDTKGIRKGITKQAKSHPKGVIQAKHHKKLRLNPKTQPQGAVSVQMPKFFFLQQLKKITNSAKYKGRSPYNKSCWVTNMSHTRVKPEVSLFENL